MHGDSHKRSKAHIRKARSRLWATSTIPVVFVGASLFFVVLWKAAAGFGESTRGTPPRWCLPAVDAFDLAPQTALLLPQAHCLVTVDYGDFGRGAQAFDVPLILAADAGSKRGELSVAHLAGGRTGVADTGLHLWRLPEVLQAAAVPLEEPVVGLEVLLCGFSRAQPPRWEELPGTIVQPSLEGPFPSTALPSFFVKAHTGDPSSVVGRKLPRPVVLSARDRALVGVFLTTSAAEDAPPLLECLESRAVVAVSGHVQRTGCERPAMRIFHTLGIPLDGGWWEMSRQRAEIAPELLPLFDADTQQKYAGLPEFPWAGREFFGAVRECTVPLRPFVQPWFAKTGTRPGIVAPLEPKDEIVTVEGRSVSTLHELDEVLSATGVGNLAQVVVLRQGHELRCAIPVVGVGVRRTLGEEVGLDPPGLALGIMAAPARNMPGLFERLKTSDSGKWDMPIVICGVHPNGPAAAAGLQPKDLLLRVNDAPIHDPGQDNFVRQLEPGQRLTVWREGTIRQCIVPPAYELWSQKERRAFNVDVYSQTTLYYRPGIDFDWRAVSPSSAEGGTHVVLTHLAENGPSRRAGLRAGDTLESIAGHRPLDYLPRLKDETALPPALEAVDLVVRRDHTTLRVKVPLVLLNNITDVDAAH